LISPRENFRSSSSCKGSDKVTRFNDKNNDDDVDGVEQFQAPTRGGQAPRRGKGNMAKMGGFSRLALFLTLCMACSLPAQAHRSPVGLLDSTFIVSDSADYVFYSTAYHSAPAVLHSVSSESLDFLQLSHARNIVALDTGPIEFVPTGLVSNISSVGVASSVRPVMSSSNFSLCPFDLFSASQSCDFFNPFRLFRSVDIPMKNISVFPEVVSLHGETVT
jgi:hypothetical protein